METTLTNLLWAVRDGQDASAWGDFHRIYATMIRQFARRMGLPDADADDVTQEVLLVAHRSLTEGVYDPARGRFRKWLYGVARRQSLARLRERRRRTRVQWASDSGGDLLDTLEGPDLKERAEQLWRQEWRYALLDEALRHMESEVGEKPYRAFVGYAVERREVDEVAAELGIAPSSVYVYKRRVLLAIGDWVKQFESDE